MATDADGRQAEVEIRLEGTLMTLVLDSGLLKGVRYPLMIRSSIQTQAMQVDFQKTTYTNDNGAPACPPIRVIGGSVYLY